MSDCFNEMSSVVCNKRVRARVHRVSASMPS